MGADTTSVVFPLADFDPEHPDVDWKLTVDGRLVRATDLVVPRAADGAALGPPGLSFDEHPVTSPQGRRPVVNYKIDRWEVSPRIFVTIEVWAEMLGEEEVWRCRLEANPARLHDPHGWALCPLELCAHYMIGLVIWLTQRGIIQRACPHVLMDEVGDVDRGGALDGGACSDWACLNHRGSGGRSGYGLSVNRLDVGVDVLEVRDIPLWRQVVNAHSQARLQRKENTRGDRRIAVSNGNRGVRFSLYDKALEGRQKRVQASARAPEGTMRLEAQLHKDWLRQHCHISVLEDIDKKRAGFGFHKAFQWAGLDRAVGGVAPLRPRKLTDAGPTFLRNFWSWMNGAVAPGTGRSTLANYRRFADKLGYVQGVPPHALGPPRRLDLVTCREVPVELDWALASGFGAWKISRRLAAHARAAGHAGPHPADTAQG